jgi:serine/threonine protein kinase
MIGELERAVRCLLEGAGTLASESAKMNPAPLESLGEPPTLICEGAPPPTPAGTRLSEGTRVLDADVLKDMRDRSGSGTEVKSAVDADGAPAVGTVIGGVYRVLGSLGSGAMGVVVLALDETLDRRVAIKFIRPDFVRSDNRDRFGDEARAMARVNHPNVLHIYSLAEHDDMPYFVMELVEGPTLEQWLFERGSPPDLEVAAAILDETCRGVSAIHAADTIHRDLKPSNILLDAGLRPRVADLGVAVICRADRPSKPEIVGTAHYMAPEIAFQREVPAAQRVRADVYSLGCVAYELLTGAPPFCGGSDIETMLLHASEELVPPSRRRPGLSPGFDAVLGRALAKDPAERTPTVEAFRRELQAAAKGGREPLRILIAEDNEGFREALEVSLQSEWPGTEIVSCADGEVALQAFDWERPSAVILDLRMPRIDGMQLTALIRARDPGHTVPILVLTALGGPEEWGRLSALGADAFLVKPVALPDVVSVIRRCLQEPTENAATAGSNRPKRAAAT